MNEIKFTNVKINFLFDECAILDEAHLYSAINNLDHFNKLKCFICKFI